MLPESPTPIGLANASLLDKPSAQQQVSARQAETVKSPSTTAEIATRARHVRNSNRERL